MDQYWSWAHPQLTQSTLAQAPTVLVNIGPGWKTLVLSPLCHLGHLTHKTDFSQYKQLALPGSCAPKKFF